MQGGGKFFGRLGIEVVQTVNGTGKLIKVRDAGIGIVAGLDQHRISQCQRFSTKALLVSALVANARAWKGWRRLRA